MEGEKGKGMRKSLFPVKWLSKDIYPNLQAHFSSADSQGKHRENPLHMKM
jgi:hypothetical protein